MESGYKPVVAAKLMSKGPRPNTIEKLEYEMRQMIQVWFDPNDPRFENVDVDEDAEPGKDGNPEVMTEEETTSMLLSDMPIGDAVVLRIDAHSTHKDDYPAGIAKCIRHFAKLYNERAMLHRALGDLGEDNTDATIAQRQSIVERIAAISDKMEDFYRIKKDYDEKGIIPSDERLNQAFSLEPEKPAVKPKKVDEDDSSLDLQKMSVEDLKKEKANAKSKITKTNNQLLYQSNTKPKDLVEKPMPDGATRIKYEHKLRRLTELVEQIDIRIAELS